MCRRLQTQFEQVCVPQKMPNSKKLLISNSQEYISSVSKEPVYNMPKTIQPKSIPEECTLKNTSTHRSSDPYE